MPSDIDLVMGFWNYRARLLFVRGHQRSYPHEQSDIDCGLRNDDFDFFRGRCISPDERASRPANRQDRYLDELAGANDAQASHDAWSHDAWSHDAAWHADGSFKAGRTAEERNSRRTLRLNLRLNDLDRAARKLPRGFDPHWFCAPCATNAFKR